MTKAPKLEPGFIAGDVFLVPDLVDASTPPLTRAKLMMQMFNQLERDAIEALEQQANPLFVADPAKLDGDKAGDVIKAGDVVFPGPPRDYVPFKLANGEKVCGCATCSRLRTVRFARAKEAAFAADKFGAGGGAGGDPGTLRAYPAPLSPLRYRCNCTPNMICNGCATAAAAPPAATPPQQAQPAATVPAATTARVNKCDCPGCQPTAEMHRIAGLDPRAQPPVLRAIRFSGLNTPDPKRLGHGQYVGV